MDDTKGTTTERVSSLQPNTSNEPKCDCRACYNSDDDYEGGGRDERFDPPSKSWTQIMAEDTGVSATGPI